MGRVTRQDRLSFSPLSPTIQSRTAGRPCRTSRRPSSTSAPRPSTTTSTWSAARSTVLSSQPSGSLRRRSAGGVPRRRWFHRGRVTRPPPGRPGSYVIGGIRFPRDGNASTEDAAARSIECLDLSTPDPCWTVVVPDIPFPRQFSQVIAHSTSLVELGGTVNRFPSKKMEIYQCNATGFKYSGEQYVLATEIQYAKFAFLDGFFYIVCEETRRVIALSPTRRTLKPVSNMTHFHQFGGATLLGRQLYVVGGKGAAGVPSNVVERYDQDKDVWTDGTCMSVPRMRHGCVTICMSWWRVLSGMSLGMLLGEVESVWELCCSVWERYVAEFIFESLGLDVSNMVWGKSIWPFTMLWCCHYILSLTV